MKNKQITVLVYFKELEKTQKFNFTYENIFEKSLEALINEALEEQSQEYCSCSFDESQNHCDCGDGEVWLEEREDYLIVEIIGEDILSKNDIKFIQSLSSEIKNQEHHSSSPYGFIIGAKVKKVVEYEKSSKKSIYFNEQNYLSFNDFLEELKKSKDLYSEAINFIETKCKSIDDVRYFEYDINRLLNGNSCRVYAYEEYNNYTPSHTRGNFFLTKKEAISYINKYRYNFKDEEPFVEERHLYRNTQMEKLVELVHKIGNKG